MNAKNYKAEIEAGIKASAKFLGKVSITTDYQAKLKRDIEYINRVLQSGGIKELISCNIIMWANYEQVLKRTGFIPIHIYDLLKMGYECNLHNIEEIRCRLLRELVFSCSVSAVGETAVEYILDKVQEAFFSNK